MIWGVVAAVIVLGGAGVVIWMTRRRGTHELFEVPGVEGDLSFICSTSALADTSKDTLFVCGEETVHRVNMMRREAIGSFPLPPGAGKLLDCVVTGDKLLLALFTDAGRGLLVGLNTEYDIGRLPEKAQFGIFQSVGNQGLSRQSLVTLDPLGFR